MADEVKPNQAPDETPEQPEQKFSPFEPAYPGTHEEAPQPPRPRTAAPAQPEEPEEEATQALPQTQEQMTPAQQRRAVLEGAGIPAAQTEAGTKQLLEKERREQELTERNVDISGTVESAAETEEDQETENLPPPKKLPTKADLLSDQVIDGVIISVMGIKDIIDASLFGFDGAAVGALLSAFFITAAIALRSLQKTKTSKAATAVFGIILLCEAIPILAMIPSAVALFYLFRFETGLAEIKTKIPLKSSSQ